MIDKFKHIVRDPRMQETLSSIKPKKNIWGILSVLFFFLLPEAIAFIWGDAIHLYCQTHLSQALSLEDTYYYKGIDILFAQMSYFNVLFGFGLLIWLFF